MLFEIVRNDTFGNFRNPKISEIQTLASQNFEEARILLLLKVNFEFAVVLGPLRKDFTQWINCKKKIGKNIARKKVQGSTAKVWNGNPNSTQD